MGVSTFFGLNIGVSGLEVAQQAESVISNNIANANTSGYAVETTNIVEGSAFPPNGETQPVGQIGQGSVVQSVQRQTDSFVNEQDRANMGTQQMAQTHQQVLNQIQSILNEPSSNSMQNAVDQFFQSWQTLSTDPSNTAARQAVISQAQTLGQTFGTITGQLENLQSTLTQTVQGQLGELDNYASQVAQLNQQIVEVQQSGQNPNSLMDQRSTFLDKMAQLANITVTSNSDGSVSVAIPASGTGGSSVSLVNHNVSYSINQSSGITSGAIAGNTAGMNDTTQLLGNLNSFLNGFSTQVNNQQAAGYPLNGSSTAPALFTVTTNSGNTYLTVSSGFTTNDVAAASSANNPGDNSNALAMVQLQNNPSGSTGSTFDQSLSAIVSGIGVEADAVNSSVQTANALAQQSSNLRSSISGVDINTQAAQMIQFQSQYDAAAKFISVFDSMLQTLIQEV